MGAPSHAPGWTDLNRLMTCLHASYPLEFEAMVNHNSFYFKAVLQVSFLIAAVASTVLAQALSYQGAAHEHSMLVILFEYLGMSSVWIFRHILPVGDDDEEPVAEVAPSEIRAALRGELQTLPTFEGAVIASSSIDEEPSSTARGNTVPASPFKTIATADLTSPATHPAAASSAASNVNAINVDESIAARAGVALASVGSRGIVAIASTAKDLIWMSSAFVGERIASVLNLAPSNSALPAQIPMSALGASAQSEAAQTSSSANTVRVQVMQAIDAVETRNAQSLFSSARWLTGCTRDCISGVVMLTVIDLAAAGFGFFGLVYAGSGIFAVVNSASLAVTAVLSRFLLKRPLSRPKVIAVAVVSGGLAFAGLGALLAPEQGSTAPMLLTATQTVRLEEHSFFSGTTRIVFGIVFTLFSTVLYSLEYVFAEQILLAAKRDKSITATQLCGYMGFTGTALFSTYVLFYTIPHWNHLVTQEMIRHRGKVPTVMMLYFVFLIAEGAYNMLYFVLLETVGALVAGVLQGLRAVLVFIISSILFCKHQQSQCFNLFKGFSTLIVVGGVIVYAFISYMEEKQAALNALSVPIDSPELAVDGNSIESAADMSTEPAKTSAPAAAAPIRPPLYQFGLTARQTTDSVAAPVIAETRSVRALHPLPFPGSDAAIGEPAVFTPFVPLPPPPAPPAVSALAVTLATSVSTPSHDAWTNNSTGAANTADSTGSAIIGVIAIEAGGSATADQPSIVSSTDSSNPISNDVTTSSVDVATVGSSSA